MKQVAEKWKQMCKAEKAKWCFDPPVPKVRKRRAMAPGCSGPSPSNSSAQAALPHSLAGLDAGPEGVSHRSDDPALGAQLAQGVNTFESADKPIGADTLLSRPAKVPRLPSAPLPSVPELVSRQCILAGLESPNGAKAEAKGAHAVLRGPEGHGA